MDATIYSVFWVQFTQLFLLTKSTCGWQLNSLRKGFASRWKICPLFRIILEMRLRTGLWRSSHYFREIVQDDDLYYSVMATEIPLKVSYSQQTALYLSCPVIILSSHFHLKEMSGYYKLCHVRRHPLLQTLLPLSAGGFLRTRTRRPCRPTGTGGSGWN